MRFSYYYSYLFVGPWIILHNIFRYKHRYFNHYSTWNLLIGHVLHGYKYEVVLVMWFDHYFSYTFIWFIIFLHGHPFYVVMIIIFLSIREYYHYLYRIIVVIIKIMLGLFHDYHRSHYFMFGSQLLSFYLYGIIVIVLLYSCHDYYKSR